MSHKPFVPYPGQILFRCPSAPCRVARCSWRDVQTNSHQLDGARCSKCPVHLDLRLRCFEQAMRSKNSNLCLKTCSLMSCMLIAHSTRVLPFVLLSPSVVAYQVGTIHTGQLRAHMCDVCWPLYDCTVPKMHSICIAQLWSHIYMLSATHYI